MNHYEIVKRLIDSKAVNFEAIGKFISENGASLAFDEGPEICGTGRPFLHIYRLTGLGGFQGPQESLENLAKVRSEIG